ncbi:hypothetical protein Tco_0844064 [Tanacetum coccineum]
MNPMTTMDKNVYNQQSYSAPVIHQTSVVPQQLYQSYQAPIAHKQSSTTFPQLDSGLVVTSFILTDDPIASLNKAMTFISTTFAPRYLTTNNQLRTTSNPRNQATIQDGRVTMQNVQGRQTQSYGGNSSKGNATRSGVIRDTRNSTATQSKFKEKLLVAQAQEAGVALNEEQLAFLADTREKVDSGTDVRVLTTTAIFQSYDIDAFAAPAALAAFMANISSYDSNVLFEVPNYDTYHNNTVFEQSLQEMEYSEQHVIDDDSNIKITSDNNVISYDQYLKENENEAFQSTTSPEQQDSMIMFVIEDMSNQVAKCNAVNQENKTVNESLTVEVERYKEHIKIFKERQNFELTDRENYIDSQIRFEKKDFSEKQDKYIEEIVDLEKKKKAFDNIVYKMGQFVQTMHMLTTPQVFYDDTYKTTLGYQNPLYLCKDQRKQPVLYCGHTLVKKHDSLSVIDTEETLILAEEIFEQPPVQLEPVQNDLPRELPTISLVKQSLQKLKSPLYNFDKVITVKTNVTGQNEGTWRFKHIRGAFEKDVIPFVKSLRESFHNFDQGIFKEINEMKAVFNQMETEVDQCSVDRRYFKIENKELLIENDRLLEQILSQDIGNLAMHSNDDLVDKYDGMKKSYVEAYNQCLELEAEL